MKQTILLLAVILSLAVFLTYAQNNARMLSTPNTVTGTPYTFVAADTTRAVIFNSASAIAASLPNGATFGFGAGTMLSVVNAGAGTVTITCSSCTITANGSASATLALATGQGADIYGGYGSPAVNYAALPSPSATNNALLNANNAFTGNNTFAGTSGLNGGGNLSGTFTGSPTLSGNPIFSGNVSFTPGSFTVNASSVSIGVTAGSPQFPQGLTTGTGTALNIGTSAEMNVQGAASFATGGASQATVSYNTTSQALGASYNNDTAVPLSRAAIEYCGATSGATQACAKTQQISPIPIMVWGDVLLNAATSQSITTLPFTDATYSCSGSDLTTAAGVISFNTYAAASVTIQESGGTNADHLRYFCIGH